MCTLIAISLLYHSSVTPRTFTTTWNMDRAVREGVLRVVNTGCWGSARDMACTELLGIAAVRG
jgi:hypothetical protein